LNYIREINAFYDWLETNTLADSAINLWHALMHVANKAGWPEEFAVALSTLQSKTGLKKDAVITARNRLQTVGRITFRSRSGQQSAVYHMVPLINCVGLTDTNPDTNPVTNSAQTPTQTPTLTPTLTPPINKLNRNETKQKNINNPPLFPPEVSGGEREILNKLKDITGYPFNYDKDLGFIRQLAVDYPAVDILEQVKSYTTWLLDNPYKANSNPRSQFRNWCKNSIEYANKRNLKAIKGGKKQNREEEIDFGFHKV